MPDRLHDHAAVVAIARIVMTLVEGTRDGGGARGIAAICGSCGPSDAVMLEVA